MSTDLAFKSLSLFGVKWLGTELFISRKGVGNRLVGQSSVSCNICQPYLIWSQIDPISSVFRTHVSQSPYSGYRTPWFEFALSM